MTMGRLDGKVAVISGGARGIGAAEARRFVAEGARVVIGDRRDDDGAATAAEIGDACRFVHLDVTVAADWDALVAATLAEFGRLDVLVANAGVNRVVPLRELTEETFRMVVDTNLVGTFLGVKAVIEPMVASGGGSIVTVASPQAFEGRSGMAAYASSKFGIRGLTRTAAIELGPLGIRVNAVVPGPIRTAMTRRPGWTEEQYQETYGALPLGRMGEPDDVAELALFLASDEARYCTGGEHPVDGGLLAGRG
jgi:3alpha(or 20beta)-hydroxysteroid dehydrogenase